MAYAAGDLLVRAVMQCSSGLPADAVINDFAIHYNVAQSDEDILSGIFGPIDQFYNSVQASGDTVGEYISHYVNRGATHELQCWRLAGGLPLGSPDVTDPWLGPTTPPGGSEGLPAEVAAVLSFHADLTGVLEESGATRPRARRRGRIYLGPLTEVAVDTFTPPFMLSSGFLTTVRQAAVQLYDNLSGPDDTGWAVWSRADSTLRKIIGGWTDNAPDIQRRRGPKATTRVTWAG